MLDKVPTCEEKFKSCVALHKNRQNTTWHMMTKTFITTQLNRVNSPGIYSFEEGLLLGSTILTY